MSGDGTSNGSDASDRQDRLDEILAELMRTIDAGESVDTERWLTRYPEFAAELREFLAKNERVEKLVRPLRQAVANVLHIRCPHCHNPIELLEDAPLTDISCPSCGSSFSMVGERPTTHFPAGSKTIGHFELLDHVGIGQFGSVWKARDTKLDRTVAVKIPRHGRLDEAETVFFLRDARAAAQLKHPNIVSVHEVGKKDDTIYIVSDFIEGATLKERMAANGLTPRETAELCVKIAKALHHAHEAGVIHRDLKPGNIMMDTEGEPHIVDFGLAKREAGEITMTVEGQILGTPAYMSPEQARGEGHSVDRRADIYSLGVILFELLTGELPFRGDKQMLIVQILKDDPPSPRKLNSSLPRDLDTICLRCLEKEPNKRYVTVDHMADDLTRWLEGHPIVARRSGAWERAVKWARRRPAVAALVGVSCTASILLIVGLMISNILISNALNDRTSALGQVRIEQQNTKNALADRTKAHGELTQTLAREERTAYNRAIALVHGEWFANNVANAERILDELPKGLRDWEYDYLKRVCHLELRTIQWETTPTNSIAFSPDGVLLAAGAGDLVRRTLPSAGAVRVWEFATGEVRFTCEKGDIGPVHRVVFGPNGKLLAASDVNGLIKIWDTSTGKAIAEFKANGRVTDLVFSRDGSQVVSADDRGAVVWDVATGDETRRFPFPASSLALSHDGRLLACARLTVTLRDFATGDEIMTFRDETRGFPDPFDYNRNLMAVGIYSTAFSPNGKLIAAASRDGSVHVWEASTGSRRHTLYGHAAASYRLASYRLAFSPDGRYLVSVGGDYVNGSVPGEGQIWEVASGKRIGLLRGHLTAVTDVAFHPKGQLLATVTRQGKIKIWDFADWQEFRILNSEGRQGIGRWNRKRSNLAFSPSGKYVATSLGITLKVWEIPSFKGVLRATATRERALAAAFSPDGKRIAFTDSSSFLKVVDVATATELLSVQTPDGSFPTVVYAPDGHRIITFGQKGGTIWDADTGTRIESFAGRTVFASPNGQYVAILANNTVNIWSKNSEREVPLSLNGTSYPTELAISDDGSLIATASDGIIKLWDTKTGREIVQMAGHADIAGISIHPNGRRVASCSSDTTVKIWDAESGEELLTFLPTIGPLGDVAFSPDGRLLAARGNYGRVAIWSAGE